MLFLAGCVGKEEVTPIATPSPTSAPRQVGSTPIVAPSPASTIIATTEPKQTVNVTLKAGYKWYQDDDLSYGIAYPENWQLNEQGIGTITVNNISGWSNTVTFEPPSLTSSGWPEAHIVVMVYSNETLAKWWMQDSNGTHEYESNGITVRINNTSNQPVDLEKLKESGAVTRYGNITIHGREGYEVIYDALMAVGWSKTHSFTMRWVVFDDAPNSLYYSIVVYAGSMAEAQPIDLYNKYQDKFDNVINSFAFSANPKITNEAAIANKSVIVKITDVKLNISKLIDETGNVKLIRAATNISLYNPGTEALILSKLNYRGIAMYKKDGNFGILKPLPLGTNGFYYRRNPISFLT